MPENRPSPGAASRPILLSAPRTAMAAMTSQDSATAEPTAA